MMGIAVANGAARDLLYKSAIGELPAHQASTFSLMVLLTMYFWFVIDRWKLASSRQALVVGAGWLAMTLVFEFGFGHFIAHKEWAELLNEYNVSAGRVWVFVPLWVALAPFVIYKITCVFRDSARKKSRVNGN